MEVKNKVMKYKRQKNGTSSLFPWLIWFIFLPFGLDGGSLSSLPARSLALL
jgi:hypothetical protein